LIDGLSVEESWALGNTSKSGLISEVARTWASCEAFSSRSMPIEHDWRNWAEKNAKSLFESTISIRVVVLKVIRI